MANETQARIDDYYVDSRKYLQNPTRIIKSKNIILHVGLHKTGTTFLQEAVFPNIKDILYYYKPGHLYELTDVGKMKTLISNEEMSRSMPTRIDKFINLAALQIKYPNAKIIVGTRDLIPWLRSCYAQTIKTGSYKSYEKFLETYDIVIPSLFIEKIKSMWKDVYVYDHGELVRTPERIINQMCRFMKVETPEWEMSKPNVSIKGWRLKYWRYVNIILRGEFWRKHIESPWAIFNFIPSRIRMMQELRNKQ